MGHSSDRAQFICPPIRGYTRGMKTLRSSFKFASSDPAKFRLHVLEYGKKYGARAACDAFKVGKSTYYDWRQAFAHPPGKVSIAST